jgi:hypothetical protein
MPPLRFSSYFSIFYIAANFPLQLLRTEKGLYFCSPHFPQPIAL